MRAPGCDWLRVVPCSTGAILVWIAGLVSKVRSPASWSRSFDVIRATTGVRAIQSTVRHRPGVRCAARARLASARAMCTLAVYVRCAPGLPLLVAANRDEFLDRPTADPRLLAVDPWVVGGQDLSAGGTWFGVNERGMVVGLLNRRRPGGPGPRRCSRAACSPSRCCRTAGPRRRPPGARSASTAAAYNAFNLLVADRGEALVATNRGGAIQVTDPRPGRPPPHQPRAQRSDMPAHRQVLAALPRPRPGRRGRPRRRCSRTAHHPRRPLHRARPPRRGHRHPVRPPAQATALARRRSSPPTPAAACASGMHPGLRVAPSMVRWRCLPRARHRGPPGSRSGGLYACHLQRRASQRPQGAAARGAGVEPAATSSHGALRPVPHEANRGDHPHDPAYDANAPGQGGLLRLASRPTARRAPQGIGRGEENEAAVIKGGSVLLLLSMFFAYLLAPAVDIVSRTVRLRPPRPAVVARCVARADLRPPVDAGRTRVAIRQRADHRMGPGDGPEDGRIISSAAAISPPSIASSRRRQSPPRAVPRSSATSSAPAATSSGMPGPRSTR